MQSARDNKFRCSGITLHPGPGISREPKLGIDYARGQRTVCEYESQVRDVQVMGEAGFGDGRLNTRGTIGLDPSPQLEDWDDTNSAFY